MITIPSLLRTLNQQQDKQQLNVDLSFATQQVRNITHIDSKAQTAKNIDPAEALRNKQFREKSSYPNSPDINPLTASGMQTETSYVPSQNAIDSSPVLPSVYRQQQKIERLQNDMILNKTKDLNFTVKQQKVAAMNKSSIQFGYYDKAERPEGFVTNTKTNSHLGHLCGQPSEPEVVHYQKKCSGYGQTESRIKKALMAMDQPAVFVPTKIHSECCPKEREFDLAAPWRKKETYAK
ncbi:Conserved_hypothetical protein [Hexamita inflata]|uniref:Uncharacterized protein n=1 Tax=Hexamita inflata TaxID=28002 RepID=A0AA86R6Y5_9EUKA|nr:Conserved hypothetical protein [Hexamita inflata]